MADAMLFVGMKKQTPNVQLSTSNSEAGVPGATLPLIMLVILIMIEKGIKSKSRTTTTRGSFWLVIIERWAFGVQR
jgi:hypothetical protein